MLEDHLIGGQELLGLTMLETQANRVPMMTAPTHSSHCRRGPRRGILPDSPSRWVYTENSVVADVDARLSDDPVLLPRVPTLAVSANDRGVVGAMNN